MTKPKNLFILFLFCLLSGTISLQAGDYQWVRRTYSWRSNGHMQTASVPVFGDEIRIKCLSMVKGYVKVTVIDESENTTPKPPKVITDVPNLRGYSTTTLRNIDKISLIIESHGECQVEIDQYLESVGEWRLRNWLQKRATLTPRKLAVWTGEGQQTIEYQPKAGTCRVIFTQRGQGTSETICTTQDGQQLFRCYEKNAGEQTTGWLHTTEPVKFDIQASMGTSWLLEITEE